MFIRLRRLFNGSKICARFYDGREMPKLPLMYHDSEGNERAACPRCFKKWSINTNIPYGAVECSVCGQKLIDIWLRD